MRRLLLLALLLAAGSARATITFDTTACPTGIASCPTASTTSGATTPVSVTTPSFSTTNAIELIVVSVQAAASAGAITIAIPTFSAGSFGVTATVAGAVQEKTTTPPT